MEIETTSLEDVLLIKPTVHGDARGYFVETWHEKRYEELGISGRFVQDNQSRSRQHILRGLHYQRQKPQGKLVRVSLGAVFDVAVDLRRSSSTFGQWWGSTLSDENQWQMWVPPGFAHGFYVLSEVAEFQYKCTEYYTPDDEHALAWNDPTVGICWPLVNDAPPDVSAKDSQGTAFADAVLFD